MDPRKASNFCTSVNVDLAVSGFTRVLSLVLVRWESRLGRSKKRELGNSQKA